MRSTDLTIEARIQRRENWRALRERCKMKIEEEEKRVDYSTTTLCKMMESSQVEKGRKKEEKGFFNF